MVEIISGILLMCATFFMLVAAIGVIKFSDVYMRMHAITKALSLGLILALSAMILQNFSFFAVFGALLAIFFVILTTPIGSHMIARAAYRMGVKKGKHYVSDDMKPDS